MMEGERTRHILSLVVNFSITRDRPGSTGIIPVDTLITIGLIPATSSFKALIRNRAGIFQTLYPPLPLPIAIGLVSGDLTVSQ